jgi:tape measure domain-containing protein
MARSRKIANVYAELSVKDKMTVGLQRASKSLSKFGDKVNRDLGQALSTGMAGAFLAAGAAAGAAFYKGISEASKMEVMETQFAALLKSEEAAMQLIEKLRKMNVESPLGVVDFSKGAKQLLGVRMTVDETTDALNKLSAISMGNAENFESLVRAFAQARSAGRLMGQEVLQFVNAGFNPLAEISIKTGESMAALKKRMEEGKISFQEVAAAITSATDKGGLFYQMNEKMARTFEGKMQKLNDNITQFYIALGKPIMERLKPELDKLNSYDFSKLGEKLGNALTFAVSAYTNGKIFEVMTLRGLAAFDDLGHSLRQALAAGINAAFDLLAEKTKTGGKNFMTFVGDVIAEYGGDEGVKDRWRDIKNREALNESMSQGYSPLGGGAPKGGPSFMDRFERYMTAGEAGGSETARKLREDADLIWNAEKLRQQKEREIRSMPEMMGPPAPMTPPAESISAAIEAAKRDSPWESSSYEVNAYQRRGLSLNEGGMQQVTKQETILSQIRDILKSIERQPAGAVF